MATLSPRIISQLKATPLIATQAAARVMEKTADEVVADMKAAAPVLKKPDADRRPGALRDSIGWTWGDAPAGTFKIADIRSGPNRGEQYATLRVTFYAGDDEAFYARFMEFGTQPHSLARNASVARGLRQGQGGGHPGTTAQPFFYPVWKKWKPKFRARIRAAVKKAIREEFNNG